MLILLKLTCFGLWLTMMMGLILAAASDYAEEYMVILHLADPQRAEYEIRSALHRIMPRARLCLEISGLNPCRSELLFIASRLQRTNPSVVIHSKAANSALT